MDSIVPLLTKYWQAQRSDGAQPSDTGGVEIGYVASLASDMVLPLACGSSPCMPTDVQQSSVISFKVPFRRGRPPKPAQGNTQSFSCPVHLLYSPTYPRHTLSWPLSSQHIPLTSAIVPIHKTHSTGSSAQTCQDPAAKRESKASYNVPSIFIDFKVHDSFSCR